MRLENRRFILVKTILVVILLCLISYIISKINNKLSTNVLMNLRESTVNASTIDGYNHIYKPDGHKIAYLTFDDGPSANITPGILKILDNYNIKATFFIVGSMAIRYPDLVREEAADGQSIGNHTYSHNYKYIYSNTNAFYK